jgi:hypothetical protein
MADAQEISLKSIWALDMPGTKDLRSPSPESKVNQLVEGMGNVLRDVPREGKTAKPAFAVSGTGEVALAAAHDVIVNGKPIEESFPLGSEVSIVFFSHLFNYYVHLDKVVRKDDTVEIYYYFVPHRTRDLTKHLALIPITLGKPGTVDVKMVQASQASTGFRSVDPNWEKRIISQPFKFTVRGQK